MLEEEKTYSGLSLRGNQWMAEVDLFSRLLLL